MNALPIRRLTQRVLAIVIIFTLIAALWQQWAFVRGLWLAVLWQAASVAVLGVCSRLLRPPISRRRAWALAGMLVVKFLLLYGLGYCALRWWAPGAWGLAAGLTMPWMALVAAALMQLGRDIAQPTAVS